MDIFEVGVKYGSVELKNIPVQRRTYEICIAAVHLKGKELEYVPENLRTGEMCLAAVQQNGNALKYVPEELITNEMCLAAVRKNGESLQYVPEEKKTEEMCLIAVHQYGELLKRVPENFKTDEICLAAVQQNGGALKYVPKEKRTGEMYILAEYPLQHIPEEKLTETAYLAMVQKDANTLQYVPEEMRTETICLTVVQQDGTALAYISQEQITEKVCLAAVKQNGDALQFVPIDMQTEEMCIIALKQAGLLLKYVIEDNKTEAVCLEAVQQDAYALRYMSSEKRTEAVCLAAVKQDGFALQYVPGEKLTEEVCLAAVQQDGEALQCLPEEKRTESVCLAAVKQNCVALYYVPEEKLIEQIYLEVVKQDGTQLQYVPEEKLTEQMYIEAVKQNVVALRYVPEEERTEAILLEAVKHDPSVLRELYEEVIPEEVWIEMIKNDPDSIILVPNELETEKMFLIAVENGYGLDDIPKDKLTEKICMAAVCRNAFELEYVPKELMTEEMVKEAVGKRVGLLQYVPKEMLTEEVYEVFIKNNPNFFDAMPKEKLTLGLVKIHLAQKGVLVEDKDIIEYCKIHFPQVLYNMGRADEIYRMIEEKILDSEIPKLKKLIGYANRDRKYFDEILVEDFYMEYFPGRICNFLNNTDRMFSPTSSKIIDTVEEFEKVCGHIPDIEVVRKWDSPVLEYNKKEHDRLLSSGVIKKSYLYQADEHNSWILKMYQVFGYENALKLLDNIPEITEEMLHDLIAKNEEVTKEIFEKKYILTGEISLSVELINKINNIAGKDAQKVFDKINKVLESKNSISLKEILIKYGFDERTIDKIANEINLKINREKIEKIEEPLRNAIEQNITHQQGRIHDLIQKVIKHQIQENKEITEENLLSEVIKELNRKDEAEEYAYSPVIRREEKYIEETIKQFMAQNGIEKILNNNIIKILKRSKEKIGQGWIRKIIGIPQEMTKEEYEAVCQKLGLEVEHIEEIKLRAKDDKTKEEAMKLLQRVNCPEIITFEKLEVMFGGLHSPYSKAFGKYFMEHKEEIMTNPEYIENFARMHNKFDIIINNSNIRAAYDEGRLEVKTVLDITLNNHYIYGKGEAELAKRAKEAQLEEMYWENAQEVFKITRQREESTIPPVKAEGKKYRGRMLRVDDPLQLFVGDMTGCCQKFGDVGAGAMLHGSTEKNGGIFVIEEIDEKGKVVKLVAQSWTWRNDDVMCFDNIEVKGDNLTHEEQEEVLRIYKESAEQAIKMDSEILEQMYKNGKITKEQYEYYTLKEVRIGLGYNQGMPIMEEKITNGEVEKSYDEVRPKEANKVYKIGMGKVTPWVDSEMSIIIAKNENLTRNDKALDAKDIPISYRKIRGIREEKGYEIDEDMIDAMKQIEAESYRKEQQIMQDCETLEDIAYEYNCEAEDIKLCISRDNDWYAMYYEEGNSVYIADIALVNGKNAEKSEQKTETLISSIELAKKMYEVFIEAAKTGKTITCDATKDTSGLNIDTMIKQGLVKVIEDEDYEWEDSSIEMRKMTLVPNQEKLEKELKKVEELLKKAEKRRMAYKAKER